MHKIIKRDTSALWFQRAECMGALWLTRTAAHCQAQLVSRKTRPACTWAHSDSPDQTLPFEAGPSWWWTVLVATQTQVQCTNRISTNVWQESVQFEAVACMMANLTALAAGCGSGGLLKSFPAAFIFSMCCNISSSARENDVIVTIESWLSACIVNFLHTRHQERIMILHR